MIMLLRIILLICIFNMQITHALPVVHHFLTKTLSVSSFSGVYVNGRFDVKLHTGYQHPRLTIRGDIRALENLQISVVMGVLQIALRDPTLTQFGPISVDIHTRYLNDLVYRGRGNISGHHLRANLERLLIDNSGSTSLSGTVLLGYVQILGGGYTQIKGVAGHHIRVKISGNSKVRLTGTAGLTRLDMAGKSWFSLSWVKSTGLIVRGCDKAYIELAGIVNKLDAELWNSARLNARYLRARRAYVKTHDYSVARISATRHQHTFAADASDIRFYTLPKMKTDFMAHDGAVLDMRMFNTPFVEEATPYNR